MLLMKRQLVVTNIVLETDISTLLGSWFTNTRYYVHEKKGFTLCFRKNLTCFNVSLLSKDKVFSVFCKVVNRWVTRSCFFMNDTNSFTACVRTIHAFLEKLFINWIPRSTHKKTAPDLRVLPNLLVSEIIRDQFHTLTTLFWGKET